MARPIVRWVVPDDAPLRLDAALARLEVPADAVVAGSVFINGVRALEPRHPLRRTDLIEVYRRHDLTPRCRVVERRGDLWVVDKPASLASEPTHAGAASALQQLQRELQGQVHLHSRLDVGVGGLMLVSTTRQARAHVEALRKRGRLSREYLAIGVGAPKLPHGVWQSPVQTGRRGQQARTRYRTLATLTRSVAPRSLALLLLTPETGRTHQLRQHCANAGLPLLGDRRYRGDLRVIERDGGVLLTSRIMLQAVRVALSDSLGRPWQVTLRKHELGEIWERLGGEQAEFE